MKAIEIIVNSFHTLVASVRQKEIIIPTFCNYVGCDKGSTPEFSCKSRLPVGNIIGFPNREILWWTIFSKAELYMIHRKK